VGDPWPFNGWVTSDAGLASTAWQRFRYAIHPHHQELWINTGDDGASWELKAVMPLPEEAQAPASAPLYRYFEQFEGVRLYFRGYANVSVDYLHAWTYGDRPLTARILKGPAGLAIAFPTALGNRYWLEMSADLSTWTDAAGPWQGDGRDWTLDLPAAAGDRFYRIRSEADF
jgi:hypothetical protein